MRNRNIVSLLLSVILLSISSFVPLISHAAPSSTVYPVDPNYITIGFSQTETIKFDNTAGTTDLNDVASTIQYITLAAALENPSSASIELWANWEIYTPGTPTDTLRTSGTVEGHKSGNVIFAPYSLTTNIDIYTWNLGKPSDDLEGYTLSSQFSDGLKILRPHEYLLLTITINCLGGGDCEIVFFFRGSEKAPTSVPVNIGDLSYDDTPVEDISDPDKTERMNLFYQDIQIGNPSNPTRQIGWWPLHNSLDPYDADINDGHVFKQTAPDDPLKSWARDPLAGTQGGFSKTKKMVHQVPGPPNPCIHLVKSGPDTASVDDEITYVYYVYTVTNCGNVPLSDVTVTDSLGITVNYDSGDTNEDDKLDLTETWIFTATHIVQASPDPLLNTATAAGKYDTTEVTDEDNHSVDIITIPPNLCINIDKDGPATAQVGQVITYVYTVTNCGDERLSDVRVEDQDLGITLTTPDSGDTHNVGYLDIDETWIFTATYTVQESDSPLKENTATAYGYYDTTEVTDDDSHSVEISIPPAAEFNFHICGFKFNDLNGNGHYDEGEPKIDGVVITLLGADMVTPAEEYYSGDIFEIPINPEATGEEGLIGHYCFNVIDVNPDGGIDGEGTYIFYIREDVPEGNVPTTPFIIGPIILVAQQGGPDRSPSNIFGNTSLENLVKNKPVGGTILPLNSTQLLIPWIILGAVVFSMTVSFVMFGKRR